MGYEITPSMYNPTCWGVFMVDFYTLTHTGWPKKVSHYQMM